MCEPERAQGSLLSMAGAGWTPAIFPCSTRKLSKIINLRAVYNQREGKEAVIYSGNFLHFSSSTSGMVTTPISQ